MAEDLELAKAVDEREHWTLDGPVAVYAPPGAREWVRVQAAVHAASARERYAAAVMARGVASHTARWPTAVLAVIL